MKKVVPTALLLTFSAALFAVENDGTGDKPVENLFCQLLKTSCTKVDQDSVGGKAGTHGAGKNRDDNNRPSSIPVFSGNPKNTSQTRPSRTSGRTGNQIVQGSS